ncbi:hypothetical protein HDV05_001831 [Chytridiales sp. JEL 0842]|nr:hypothetical protein HDV05_001831 [Chytridiales sp. JEL 0842]
MKRRASRPQSGYLAKKRGSQGSRPSVASKEDDVDEDDEEGSQQGETVDEDGAPVGSTYSNLEDSSSSIVDDDELFGEWLPSDDELRYRWQRWARQYRARILLEQAAAHSLANLEAEDQQRCRRMQKVNPVFVPRNWILDEIISKVTSMPAVQPIDPDIERINKQIRDIQIENAHFMSNQRLRRDLKPEPVIGEVEETKAEGDGGAEKKEEGEQEDQSEEKEKEEEEEKEKEKQEEGEKEKDEEKEKEKEKEEEEEEEEEDEEEEEEEERPEDKKPMVVIDVDNEAVKCEAISETLSQVLKIIVGDAFGAIVESSKSWSAPEDKAAAERWAGPTPPGHENLQQNCYS